jgi:hypothetical protein
VQDVVQAHVGDVGFDVVRDLRHEALDLEVGDDLLEHAAVLFALGLALKDQRDGDLDALVEVDAGEVDVEDFDPEVVELHVLHEDGLVLAVDREAEHVRAVVEVADELLLREGDGDDGFFMAVDDARDEAGVAEALVAPGSELTADLYGDLSGL